MVVGLRSCLAVALVLALLKSCMTEQMSSICIAIKVNRQASYIFPDAAQPENETRSTLPSFQLRKMNHSGKPAMCQPA